MILNKAAEEVDVIIHENTSEGFNSNYKMMLVNKTFYAILTK